MVARSFDTADRGVQAVRRDAGAGLRADPEAPEHDMRYRLDVVASSVVDVVRFAGGWLFDRAMAGWDVTVLLTDRRPPRDRPLQILGAQTLDLEHALASVEDPSPSAGPGGRGGSVRAAIRGCGKASAGPRSRRHRGHAVGGDLAGRAGRQRRPGPAPAELGRADIQGSGAGRRRRRRRARSVTPRPSAAGCWPGPSVAADLVPAG